MVGTHLVNSATSQTTWYQMIITVIVYVHYNTSLARQQDHVNPVYTHA